jgi:predicted nucleic acid-binding protein
LNKIVVSDTGPLIALALAGLLPKLNQLFVAVHIPNVVHEEAIIDNTKPGAQGIINIVDNPWVEIKTITLSHEFEVLADLLDSGEAAAIALAKQEDALLLIDERKGRRVATHYNISIIGTAAVLIKAKQQGMITAVKPLLETLTKQGYRFSPKLIQDILARCNEGYL